MASPGPGPPGPEKTFVEGERRRRGSLGATILTASPHKAAVLEAKSKRERKQPGKNDTDQAKTRRRIPKENSKMKQLKSINVQHKN